MVQAAPEPSRAAARDLAASISGRRRGARPAPARPGASQLTHWPVQLGLVSPNAPWLAGADVLLAADCVPFAYADFHRDLLAGRRVLVGCPKLDDVQAYVAKLVELFRSARPSSVTVAQMEVPCCGGIAWAAHEAVRLSGVDGADLRGDHRGARAAAALTGRGAPGAACATILPESAAEEARREVHMRWKVSVAVAIAASLWAGALG